MTVLYQLLIKLNYFYTEKKTTEVNESEKKEGGTIRPRVDTEESITIAVLSHDHFGAF